MLKKFEVSGYRGFKQKISFDLSARDYEFNRGIVKEGVVNKAIIYGKNNTGKSNLGLALFDLVFHLTDSNANELNKRPNYQNAELINSFPTFIYTFQFDDDIVVYKYSKSRVDYLIQEDLFFNDEHVLSFNYFNKENNFIKKDLINNLQVALIDNKLSVVKYIYKNTPTDKNSLLFKLMFFVEHMLWYRSLSDGNTYIGYTNNSFSLTEKIYELNKKEDFQLFLSENDINYNLEWVELNGKHELMVVFSNGVQKRFIEIASTGTMTLLLFYAWSIAAFNDISLLFVDEFDAFLHFESAESIVKRLNKNKNFQTILTSHNTYLMQNKITRPDCCYILTKTKISNLYDSTDKDIREAHNLEKMYINGVFVE